MKKTILTCAVTGNHTTLGQNAALPCTPEQIAKACIDAAKAGAAIAHIHVRHADGRPSSELEHYREVINRIRDAGNDLIVNFTTGPGGRFVPSKENPSVAGPGTNLRHPLERVEHVVALRPDICTLDLNTMWSVSAAVINTPENVTAMAQAIREAGCKPELEVFDSGDIQLAKHLISAGVLERRSMFQIVTGVRFGFEQTPQTMAFASSMLPADAVWGGFGIGRMAFPMLAQAYLLGGHVRIGMEDTVHMGKGELAPSNAALVEKAVAIVESLGGTIASVAEARELLGLPRSS